MASKGVIYEFIDPTNPYPSFHCHYINFLVLLQDSKGGAMGFIGGGGGGSDTVFGTGGASSFLAKGTRWVAILFAASCLTLTYLSTASNSSVTDDFIPTATAPVEKNMESKEEAPSETNTNGKAAGETKANEKAPEKEAKTTTTTTPPSSK